jgi:uncharacterized protein YcaQ
VEELERITAIRALKALGVAPEFDIFRYFIRGRYTILKDILKQLVENGEVVNVRIEGQPKSKPLFLLAEDKRVLDAIISDKWEPRLNLISPFDNMITLRDRTKRMFNFDYILEQFVPKEKRKFGTYVLPILWDSSLVGRVDAKLDKGEKTLKINGVFAEPGFENDAQIGCKLQERIDDFANFLGAERVIYAEKKPEKWARYLT